MLKILAMAASLRKDSHNRKLVRRAAEIARAKGAEVTILDLKKYELPYYDGDLESASGIPALARELTDQIRAHDALLISSPEYNGSIPGHLKNTIDWITRSRPNAFTKKPILLMTASPGYYGGIRSHLHLRTPFDLFGAFVYPSIPAISDTDSAFDAAGALTDPEDAALLEKAVTGFVDWAGKILNDSPRAP